MRFFDRTEEIASLREIRRMSKDNAQFTVVTGRRRIGKTSLVWKAYEDEPILYFFVARKAEGDLCEDYRLEIESKLGIPTMGRAEHFADVFEFLMKLSTERPITLFIDEFQEFFRVNKSVYSDMQRIWDIYSPKARMNLVVCGSIYSMMTKIFKDKKEPLYNRQTRFMTVRPFTPAVLKEILTEYHPGHTAEDLLALYSFTGGVAKYVQLLVDLHIFKGKQDTLKDPIVITSGDDILSEEYVGRYVTVKGLSYGNRVFVILYDKNDNSLYLSDKTHGVDTWAFSEEGFAKYLANQAAMDKDKRSVPNPEDYEPAFYSVSQYFTLGNADLQVRTSGYAKFADYKLVSSGITAENAGKISLTGIMTVYNENYQFVLVDLDGVKIEE